MIDAWGVDRTGRNLWFPAPVYAPPPPVGYTIDDVVIDLWGAEGTVVWRRCLLRPGLSEEACDREALAEVAQAAREWSARSRASTGVVLAEGGSLRCEGRWPVAGDRGMRFAVLRTTLATA